METKKLVADLIAGGDFKAFDVSVLENGEFTDFQVQPANPCNDIYSIAKCYTATAFGMLFDEGVVTLNEKVVDYFPEYFENSDPNWKKVTIDMVMRHNYGIGHGFLDIDVEDINTYGTNDFMEVVARQPLPFEPDTHAVYSDAASYILSRLFTKITGKKIDDFLLERLFTPLGVREVAFSKCPLGYFIGATGIYIRSHDLVKLGAIYMNKGVYEGRRYLSEKFVELAETKGYEFCNFGKKGLFCKIGMAGQLLMYSRGDNAVIGWHSYNGSCMNYINDFISNFNDAE